MRRFTYAIMVCMLCSILQLQAQESHAHHHHGLNEIGISTGALYGIDDKVWGPGVHIHYFRSLGEHSRWAIGAFAEQAWLGETHFSVGTGVRFELIERLEIGAFPGITFAKHAHDGHTESESKFSMHAELVYDLFHWEKFHLGPAIDYSWSKEDSHTMLGVHAAYSF